MTCRVNDLQRQTLGKANSWRGERDQCKQKSKYFNKSLLFITYKVLLMCAREPCTEFTKTKSMIWFILILICAIFNLLCLVNIQAWQLALEGCWWRPLPRVQKCHMLRLPTHEEAQEHHAASVLWKHVNMHLLHLSKQIWEYKTPTWAKSNT